jgi:hypothetical protein
MNIWSPLFWTFQTLCLVRRSKAEPQNEKVLFSNFGALLLSLCYKTNGRFQPKNAESKFVSIRNVDGRIGKRNHIKTLHPTCLFILFSKTIKNWKKTVDSLFLSISIESLWWLELKCLARRHSSSGVGVGCATICRSLYLSHDRTAGTGACTYFIPLSYAFTTCRTPLNSLK